MAVFFSETFIDEVRYSNDIVDVISEYVKLKKTGKSYTGLCPFHNEKTPSFSVSPDKQIFHCFGCSEGGNVISFISKVESLDFVETIKFLADRAKIIIPDSQNITNVNKENMKDVLYKINIESAKYFRNQLNSNVGQIAKQYINKRSISDNILQKFGIGFAYGLNNDLYKHLIKLEFKENDILTSGVIVKNDKGYINDRFKMRLIFPIFDIRGRVIAFGGRVLDDKLPKYLNSPETPIFSKGKNFYCLNFAKNSKEKTAIVVEGYMDAISLYQKGMDNVVASLGTALTDNQARLLNKHFQDVAISYDGDTAGQMATLRGLDIISKLGLPVKVVQLKEAKDPDELVKEKGIQAFKNLVNSATDLPEYKINLLKNDFDLTDNRQKINFVNNVAKILAEISNNIERDVYVKKVSKDTAIGIEPIYAEINKILYRETENLKPVKKIKSLNLPNDADNKNINKKILKTERLLIAVLSNNNAKAIDIIKEEISLEDIKDDSIRSIIKQIYSIYEKNKAVICADVINLLEVEQDINIYTDIIQNEIIDSDNIKLARQLINTIKKEKLENLKKELLVKLRDDNLHKEEKDFLNIEFAKITIALKQISK